MKSPKLYVQCTVYTRTDNYKSEGFVWCICCLQSNQCGFCGQCTDFYFGFLFVVQLRIELVGRFKHLQLSAPFSWLFELRMQYENLRFYQGQLQANAKSTVRFCFYYQHVEMFLLRRQYICF